VHHTTIPFTSLYRVMQQRDINRAEIIQERKSCRITGSSHCLNWGGRSLSPSGFAGSALSLTGSGTRKTDIVYGADFVPPCFVLAQMPVEEVRP